MPLAGRDGSKPYRVNAPDTVCCLIQISALSGTSVPEVTVGPEVLVVVLPSTKLLAGLGMAPAECSCLQAKKLTTKATA